MSTGDDCIVPFLFEKTRSLYSEAQDDHFWYTSMTSVPEDTSNSQVQVGFC
jgi:hypothetical protein